MNYLLNGTAIKRIAIVTGLTLALGACLHNDDDDDTTPPAATNSAPVITSTASTTVEEGAAFSYTMTATDADADPLTLAASTKPAWMTFDAATGALSGTPQTGDVGDHSVTLTVSDGTETTSQSFTVTVTAIVLVNTPPTITSTAVTSATVGSSYSYTLTATDAEQNTLSLSSVTFPGWANFDTSTGILSGTPPTAGDYPVELMVSDSIDSVNQMFTITAIVQSTAALTVFENAALPEWAAWDCCGGSIAVITTDNIEHDQTTEFTINGETVVGFTARDADGAVGGMPFDASAIAAEGTIVFDLKMTTAPDAGAVDWRFKIESNNAASAAEVSLTSSQEMHTGPVLDTWQTYTFNISDLVAAGLDASAIDVLMVFPAWGSGNGAVFLLDNVKILSDGNTVAPPAAALTVFENEALPEWAAWDCCGGSTAVIISDDVDHDQTTEFTINGDTVVGFTARDADGAVGGMPYDASSIATEGTITFDLKMTNAPDAGAVDWRFKIESNNAATFAEVSLTSSQEQHSGPVLDTWQTYTFNISDLVAAGLDASAIDVLMVFPAWGSGNGAVFLLDNVKILPDGKVIVVSNNQMNLDFEVGGAGDAGYTWAVFENDDNPALEIVANPAADSVNDSSTVAKFTARLTGQPWAGTETKSGPTFTLDATNKIVKIMVYKTVISDVGIKFAVGAAAQPELKVANTKINEWEELTFDFSSYIGLAETINIDTIVVFPDFNLDGRTSDTVSYFDNLTFSN